MNFPKFWARGEAQGCSGWGWSNESIAQAKALGVEVAQRIAARLARGDRSPDRRYEYGDRPLREEILREFRDGSSGVRGVITRNSYGCLVLNTARLLFADVDLGETPEVGGFVNRLFGSQKAVAAHAAARQSIIDRAEEWIRQNPGWGWRIYETRAGLRLMATHCGFEPGDRVCESVFAWLHADPLYRRLCQHQKCFRARLTPKPWRCDVPPVTARWPFENDREAKSFQDWNARYLAAAARFSTCRLLAEVGNKPAPEFHEMIAVHDEACRAMSEAPLA